MADYTYRPERDATLGLIFRLNALWEKADRKALSGDIDGWELVLDRIFSNLLYRDEAILVENKKGEKEVNLNDDNLVSWKIIKRNIRLAKFKWKEALRKRDRKFITYKEEHYTVIVEYDIWLRKFMQSRNLYLKETEHNPSKALFGGAFR